MPNRTLPVALLVIVLGATHASAQPVVTIGDSIPFSASDLADAIRLRRPSNVRIHVERRSAGYQVTVGDQVLDVVDVAGEDPDHAVRVVALVIIGLFDRPPTSAPGPLARAPASVSDLDEPPAIARPEVPPRSPWAFRAMVSYQRTDGGLYTTPVVGTLAYAIATWSRITASVGFDKHGNQDVQTSAIPARLGVEGRAGALGVELGMTAIAFRQCTNELTASLGPYGTARVYVPLTASGGTFTLELGGYFTHLQYVDCSSTAPEMNATWNTNGYAGYVGAGMEWPL